MVFSRVLLKQRHKVTQKCPILKDVRERKLLPILLYTTLSYFESVLDVPSLIALANFILKRTQAFCSVCGTVLIVNLSFSTTLLPAHQKTSDNVRFR